MADIIDCCGKPYSSKTLITHPSHEPVKVSMGKPAPSPFRDSGRFF